jgi:hypothetical protein
LIDEADAITYLMSTVHDATEVNMNDDGNIADKSDNNPTNSAPEPRKVQDISPGDDATKRSHDSIMHSGHKVHPSKLQKMNFPTCQKVSQGYTEAQL